MRLGSLFAAALLAACTPAPVPDALLPVARGSAEASDIIVITMDTTRADHVACAAADASSPTPVLDRFCAEAVRFENAVTHAPVTLPAHASLFTGLLPIHHGARYNGEFRLREGVPTLAEELRDAGYETAAFVSSFVLDRRFGLARGFDTYDDAVEGRLVRRGVVSRNERTARDVTDAALRFLGDRKPGKPVFLWVHYYDPHAPYVPLAEPDQPGAAAAYAGEIADVDREIGRLLAAPSIDARRSVVVVTADHGEGLGEHDERTHGLFLYDSTMRIPMLVRLPGGSLAGRRESGLVALSDVRPTLLSLVGVAAKGEADGLDWLAGRRREGEGVYAETGLPYFDFGFAPSYSFRTDHVKLIESANPEFFDLRVDPHELDDRFGVEDARDLVGPVQQRLDAVMLGGDDIVAASAQRDAADPESLAKLRSLGYLGDAAPPPGTVLPDARERVEAVNLHQDAAAALDAGRPAEALALLARADAASPDNLSVLRLKSKVELQMGRIDDGKTTLERLVSLRRNPDSLVLLAQIHVLRDDDAGAGLLLDEAAKLDPEHGGIAIARGDMAVKQGDRAAAERFYRSAIATDEARTGAIARSRLARISIK